MAEVIHFLDSQRLIEEKFGVVCFGTAPDGLSFLTAIDAPPRAEKLLQAAALALGVDSAQATYEGTPLAPLVRDLNRLLHDQRIQHLAIGNAKSRAILVLPRSIRMLTGATLLERLFATGPSTGPVFASVQPNTAMVADNPSPLTVFKPSNLLLSRDGLWPIDSLQLAVGTRSPALTRSWAAPEQVLRFPVQFQTDQYPLGLMLLHLVEGVLYGEEAKVSIPVGARRVENHTVFRNPGVYIDGDTAPVDGRAVDAWRGLVERCVRFDAADRFPSMTALADALAPLLESETLSGHLEVSLSFGRLLLGNDGTGPLTPCWLAG